MKQEYKYLYEKFGLNVVYYRKRKKLTQLQLAELVDIDRSHISAIELGNVGVSFDVVFRLCEVLDIKPKDLFDFRDQTIVVQNLETAAQEQEPRKNIVQTQRTDIPVIYPPTPAPPSIRTKLIKVYESFCKYSSGNVQYYVSNKYTAHSQSNCRRFIYLPLYYRFPQY